MGKRKGCISGLNVGESFRTLIVDDKDYAIWRSTCHYLYELTGAFFRVRREKDIVTITRIY